jgi:DNA-binding transcriptional ArsR family regulator
MASERGALDSVFHALADPTRRAVVARLVLGSATVKELAEPFAMALPSFLKHLDVLETAQLIVCQKQGRVRTCSLERERLIAAEQWFGEQSRIWQSRYTNLDGLLKNLEPKKNGS